MFNNSIVYFVYSFSLSKMCVQMQIRLLGKIQHYVSIKMKKNTLLKKIQNPIEKS